MTTPDTLTARAASLNGLTALTIAGPDARTFLQGQLSADLRKLSAERALLATCNSAQGRVQAVITLIQSGETITAIVASSLASRLLARLGSYVLRSKVVLAESPDLVVASLTAADAHRFMEPLPSSGACICRGRTTLLRWWSADERYLLIAPRTELASTTEALADLRWRRADIASGVPQVYPETYERFVAQMLNIDLLGGISFDKGCYTGQEIIARTHYRGTVKRRMLRFTANCAVPAPGTRVLHEGIHCGEVVDACIGGTDGRGACDLLAVVSLEHAMDSLMLDGIPDSTLTRAGLPYLIEQPASTAANRTAVPSARSARPAAGGRPDA